MRYFRTYPWAFQMLLFLLMIFTLISGTVVIIGSVFQKLSGYPFSQMAGITVSSPQPLINAALVVQGVSSVLVWMLSPLLFAYLSTPRPAQYLGLRAPGKAVQPLLAILVMLGAMPVLSAISDLISHINFSASVKAGQEANEAMTNAFLHTTSFGGFLAAFLVMAIIPAVGEELFFRGIFMRFIRQRTRNMIIPVVFTAVTFAYVHSNIYGFLSIFLAGVLLAVIYNLTGSIWCSILAHMFFNGSQIILSYLGNDHPAVKAYLESNNTSYTLVAIGAAVFAASFYLLLKNKTPLPPNWADNFTPAELQELKNEQQ
jgi:membrane protease YdiL (CAAX protease family)